MTPPADPNAAPPANPPSTTEPPKVEAPAPEPLTLDALPEGINREDPLAGELLEVLNGDLSDRKALATKLAGLQQKMTEGFTKAWVDTNAQWRAEIEADPTYGGEKLEPALGKVSGLINDFATAHGGEATGTALREAFNITGAGNNPHMVRFLIWTANQLSEGAPLSGGPASGQTTRADKLFGT